MTRAPQGAAPSRAATVIHNAAAAFLAASVGFLVVAVAARHTAGFEHLADGLAVTSMWNFALAMSLLAVQAALLVGQGIVRLIAHLRGTQP